MKYLIGDIGNTSTKICILNRKSQILRSYNFDTIKMYKGNLLKNIIRKKTNKNINPVFLFSSVVPKVFMNIKKNLKSTKFKILEIPQPTFYGNEESHLKSIPYGLNVLWVTFKSKFDKK